MRGQRFNRVAGEWVLGLGAVAAVTLSPGVLLASPVGDLLSAHQIRPMEPPEAAVDVLLPDLEGQRRALSEARGRWLVLTFFASWCGPCRSEMPSLQRLHEARGADGLEVVAISVDRRQQDALQYVESLDLTFPVLWDERGEAARMYNASTIPVSFVIDPNGVVVGVSQVTGLVPAHVSGGRPAVGREGRRDIGGGLCGFRGPHGTPG